PHRAKQDWQSDEEVDHVIGHERTKQLVRRIDDGAVLETGDGRSYHEEGDDERESVYQREVTPDRQIGVTLLFYVHFFRLLGQYVSSPCAFVGRHSPPLFHSTWETILIAAR
ncbi:MAG: hypothetical protein WBF05_14960, partial [Anaerolineales bacterium]